LRPAPVLYALLFCVAIPAALAAWAKGLDRIVGLPLVKLPTTGWIVATVGVALMGWAMLTLRIETGGLPMNAFPPARRASRGPFTWHDHPIYVGFVICCAGVSVALGSSTGFWLVTPLAALGCWALVIGYERDATLRRLGTRTEPARWRLATDEQQSPDRWDRLSVYLLLFAPWLVLYEGIGHLHGADGVSLAMPFENRVPVQIWSEAFYFLAYPLSLLAPLGARARRDLRRFETSASAAMVIAFWCYLALPVVSPPRPFDGSGFLSAMLRFERADGLDGRAAFPSFHIFWTFAAAALWSRRGVFYGALAWVTAGAITISCFTTGMHTIADVVGGCVLFLIAWNWSSAWQKALRCAERIANSWREWRIGSSRILIHAVCAFVAATIGMLVTGSLVGVEHRTGLLVVSIAGLLGAGIWGQIFEASSKLSRPFGFYGHIIGAGVGLTIASTLSTDTWSLVAAIATSAPLIQSIGRVRCLVQGCCHGRPCGPGPGIRYDDPRSRVCSIANLRGKPVYATPVISILSGIAVFGLLLRLWSLDAPASFAVGGYLILSGLARFVEEHYRGEPQTIFIAGLRSYQWLAILCVIIGAVVSAMPSPALAARWNMSTSTFLDALIVGVIYAIAMGVDWPKSDRRMARLT
jgi:protein-S-isoprenylcysteine O-methyltransferase Ste14